MPASDLIDKPLTLTLGGKDRPFRYSFSSWELLAGRYSNVDEPFSLVGKWLQDGGAGLDRAVAGALVDIVWAGLIPEDKAVTREQVADLLDLKNAGFAFLVILQARGVSLPTPKEGAEPEGPPKA